MFIYPVLYAILLFVLLCVVPFFHGTHQISGDPPNPLKWNAFSCVLFHTALLPAASFAAAEFV
jgi:hypothetical protein